MRKLFSQKKWADIHLPIYYIKYCVLFNDKFVD